MIAAILSSIANIVANFVLIPRYGTAGCAFATLIAFAVSVMTFAALLRREAKMPISWTYFSVLPVVAGTFMTVAYQNPIWALLACAAMSFLVGYWFRDSLGKTLLFLKNLRM
jgi:O-antigen/teichoic acid export membrane protein